MPEVANQIEKAKRMGEVDNRADAERSESGLCSALMCFSFYKCCNSDYIEVAQLTRRGMFMDRRERRQDAGVRYVRPGYTC